MCCKTGWAHLAVLAKPHATAGERLVGRFAVCPTLVMGEDAQADATADAA